MVLHDPAKNLRWIEFDWICCLWLMSNLLNTWQLKYSRRDLCLIQIQLGGKVFDLVWNFLWFYNLLKHLKKCIPLLLSFLPPNHSGVGAARSGNLTFMVGGVEEEFAAAQELLGCMGSNVVYCGAVGTGQVTFSHYWHWFDDVKSANVPSSFLTTIWFCLTLFSLWIFCLLRFS